MTTRTLLPMLLLLLLACRKEDTIPLPVPDPVAPPAGPRAAASFYLLNEGNMGSNKATLDYYDAASGEYIRNIYAAANPTVPKEMGDVGNDLQIYGSRMWAVINCSNKVEVLDPATARRLGSVDIPNCRYIAFHGAYAYVTSYAGPVEVSPTYSQRGYVAKVDTATLQVVARVDVGYQPDGIAVSGGRLYVANSGGYMVPRYENTLTAIDLATFTVVDTVELGINLHRVLADTYGKLWVSSRGDYYDTTSTLYSYDPLSGRVTDYEMPVSDMWLHTDGMLYIISAGWSHITHSYTESYARLDTRTGDILDDPFIADAPTIQRPYGIAVNPYSNEIYVTDARTYVNPGRLLCFTPEGVLQWEVRTGDIPAHFAFLRP